MKRILVSLLAMALILSCFVAVSADVVEEQLETVGATTKVVVYKQNFEANELPSTWESGNKSQFSVSLDTDSVGNKYLKVGNWQAENIARAGAKWVQTDGVWHKEYSSGTTVKSFRIAAEAIQGRVKDNTNTVVYQNGRSYDYTWDGIAKGSGNVVKVGFGSSGINTTIGGAFLAYNTDGKGGIKGVITQLYGTNQGWTTPTAQTMKSVAGTDRGNGWYSAGYEGISYSLVKDKNNTSTPVDSVTLNGYFYQCSTPVNMIRDLLLSKKAYCGSGFTDCSAYKFTITKDDLYGDEAKKDSTGKVWTEDELCREWNLDEDCTPLYSPRRVADFQKALDEADIQYGIDNVTISASANAYTDTVKVEGEGSTTVKAITNTYLGTEENVANGGKVTVNDYYGTTYKVTTTAAVQSAFYNGKDVSVDNDGVIVIPASDIKADGELVIKTGKPAEAVKKVVVFYSDSEGSPASIIASNAGGLEFVKENGNAVVKLAGWNAQTLIDKYVAKGSTADYYPRVQFAHTDNYLFKDVKYTYSYRFKYMDGATALTDLNANQPFFNHNVPGITASVESWGHYSSGKQHGGGNVPGTVGENDWRYASKDFTPTTFDGDATSAKLTNVQAEFKGFNNAGTILDKAAKAAVEANTANGVVDTAKAAAALEAEIAKHDYKVLIDDIKLEAETYAVPVTVSSTNANVKINGVTNNDTYSFVGKGFVSEVSVKAAEGYRLTKVTIGGESQEITDVEKLTVKHTFNEAADIVVAAEKAEKVNIGVSVTEGGTVTVNGKDVANGANLEVLKNSVATVAVTPKTGYKVDSVVINGKEQEISADGGSIEVSIAGAVTISVSFREGGVTGEVIVFRKDFEDDNITGAGFDGIAEEANGNHYASLSTFGVSTIVNAGKTSATDTKNYRIGSDVFTYRFNFLNDNIEYKNGKTYSLTWDGFIYKDGARIQASKASSGFNSMSGAKLAGDPVTAGQINQWYGQTAGAKNLKGVASFDAATGWTKLGYTGIDYLLWDGADANSVGQIESATVTGLFMQWANPGTIMANLLKDHKAYQGYGMSNADSYKFTITEADIYGDEEGLKANGGTYEKADLCKEWSLSMDCSPLKSVKRTEAFQKVLDDMALEIGLDNIEMKAKAEIYNVPVDFSGTGSVSLDFVTNSYLDEHTTLSADGKISANDYYGIKAVITLASDKDYIKSITYGDDVVNVVIDETTGEMSFEIPANKVAVKTLVVETSKVTAASPVISDAKVTGEAKVGATLTAGYKYEGTSTDASTIQWQRFDGSKWSDIEGATGKTYVVKAEDDVKYIRAVINTKNTDGETWKTVFTPSVFIGTLELFVATNGKDTNDGSKNAPFATVGAARDAIRTMIANELLPAGEVYVNIRGGEYNVSAATVFSSADSAPEGTTVIYRSYPGETATFVGSTKIANSKVTKVTASDKDSYGNKIFDRVTDPMAQANLYKIDLNDYKGYITELMEWGWNDPDKTQGKFSGQYMPSELFVDGKLLTWAKWPNEEEDNAMTDIDKVIKTSDNFQSEQSTFTYVDENDETGSWNGEAIADQMLVWSYMGSHWRANAHQVESFDPVTKTITTKYGTDVKPTAGYPLFLFNILEAIDMPGESFIDRKTNIAYFYAPDAIDGTNDVRMSTYEGSMFTFNGTSNVKLDGIEIKYTKNQPLSVSATEKFEVENCVFAHSTKAATFAGSNITFKNNIVTQNGYGGITIGGGDRATLTSSNNVVENNVFTFNGRIKRQYAPAVSMNGVGVKVVGNEIAYNPHEVITFGGNDHEISENYIHHACSETGDMGAIYWGRDPSVLGVKIHDNFFYRMSNVYNGGWSQSIFADDGNYGAEIYNNIFYQGTLTLERGAQPGMSYPFKTNGGQHFRLTNNIFVDMPASAFFQSWVGSKFNSPMQGQYITYNNDAKPTDTSKGFDKAVFTTPSSPQWVKIQPYCGNEIWMEKYKGTIWEHFFTDFSQEKYDTIQGYVAQGRYDLIADYVSKYAPSVTNTFDNNVSVDIGEGGPRLTGNEVVSNHYVSKDTSIFKDFANHDFELTEEGLAEVRKKATGFENISMAKMGVDGFVGNTQAPVASNAYIAGEVAVGGTVKAYYTFADPDGDKEGASVYSWWAAEKADGKYTRVWNKSDDSMIIPETCAGKYVKVMIEPFDVNMRHGKVIESEPVFVSADVSSVNKKNLWARLTEASELVANAVVGTETGTYNQEDIDKLNAVIDEVKGVAQDENAYQYQVDAAERKLNNAITAFKLAANMDLEFMNINEIIADTDNWYATRGEPANDGKSIVLETNEEITYVGKEYLNTMFAFKMKLVPLNDKETTAINVENYSHDINGAGLIVRRQNKDNQIWSAGGYLMWMKNLTYELQEFAGANTINSYTNTVFTEYNKTYDIVFGAYDAGGVTRLVLYVDGELVGDNEFTDKMIGIDGFLGFRAPGEAPVSVVIEPADVDVSVLKKTIEDAEKALTEVNVGSEYGQHSAEIKANLESAIADAKALANDKTAVQIPVDRMVLTLEKAIADVTVAANDTANVSSDAEYDLDYNLEKADVIAANNAKVTFNIKSGEHAPAITSETAVPAGKAVMEIPAGTILKGSEITNLREISEVTAKLPGGITVEKVYSAAPSAVTADGYARFVFPGATGKRVYYMGTNGKYVEVKTKLSEDSYEAADAAIDKTPGAARFNGETDLVVYADVITEFVIFTAGVADDESDDSDNNGGGSQGGGSSASNAGGNSASSGFFTSDTTTAGLNVSNNFVFEDMKNHWAKNDVMGMYNAGIVSGVTATSFEPDRNITRAEFATLIVKSLNLTPETTADFADVKDEWFAHYVGAAAKAGIIVGSDGMFRPNDTITRQEMAVIIMKAYSLLGKTAGTGAVDNFADKADIAAWALPFVDGAATAGIISGMGDGSFAPSANATRAQAASVVSRILK